MIKIFHSVDGKMHETKKITKKTWIKLSSPSVDEIHKVISYLNLGRDNIMATIIDPEEKTRIEIMDTHTLILIDIPTLEKHHQRESYRTIPLIIILTHQNVVTICSEETPILDYFHDSPIGQFSMRGELHFVYQIMLRTSFFYQQALTAIDKKRTEFEEHIEKITDEVDLINLHELESSLVYFATSLRGNNSVFNRLARSNQLNQFQADKELLDDILIENQQAIEMAQIYRDILDGTRELMATIINSRLNHVMKRLTSITMILSIPMVISGMYGMNVDSQWVPFANTTHGFGMIGLITAAICFILMVFLKNKKML